MISSLKSNKIITIILASDYPLAFEAIKIIIERESDLSIVGETTRVSELSSMVDQLKPSMVIINSKTLSRFDNFETINHIKQHHPSVPILVLSEHEDISSIVGMFEAGVSGYLSENIFGKMLIDAIHAVICGESILPTQVILDVFNHASTKLVKPEIIPILDELTLTDLDILKLVAKGYNNQDIAAELLLSPFTVKNYLASIFSKLNVNSRTEAAIKVLQAGLIKIEDL